MLKENEESQPIHQCKSRLFGGWMISCKEYTELRSRALDETLTTREQWALKIHHVICLMCRRFNRQLNLLDQGLKRLLGDPAGDGDLEADRVQGCSAQVGSVSEGPGLSAECKEQLKRAMAGH